jgi:hypothetical protein
MKKKHYMPRAASKRLTWLKNFYAVLSKCFLDFGLTNGDMTSVFNDMNAYDYTLQLQTASDKYYRSCTKYRIAMLGSAPGELVRAFPTFTVPPNMPIAVKEGIMFRTMKLVRKLKLNSFCSASVSEALGVIGKDILVDYATLKPVISLLFTAGSVKLKFKRYHSDGLCIECKRGAETAFTHLGDVLSGTVYTDKRPNLIADKSETRHYRAFFIVKDIRIGLVSDIATIAIVGED